MIYLFCHHRQQCPSCSEVHHLLPGADGEQGWYKARTQFQWRLIPHLICYNTPLSWMSLSRDCWTFTKSEKKLSIAKFQTLSEEESRILHQKPRLFQCIPDFNFFHPFFLVACMCRRCSCKRPSFQDIICEIILMCCLLSSLRNYPLQVCSSLTSQTIFTETGRTQKQSPQKQINQFSKWKGGRK